MIPSSDCICFIYTDVCIRLKRSAHLNPRHAPDVTSPKEVKSSPKKSKCRGYVFFYVCAGWDTCCFNRRCADVTAEAKKPPLKRKDLEKEREKASSVCIKQWKNWPVKEQMSSRRLKDICFSGYVPRFRFPSLIFFGLDCSLGLPSFVFYLFLSKAQFFCYSHSSLYSLFWNKDTHFLCFSFTLTHSSFLMVCLSSTLSGSFLHQIDSWFEN